MKNINAPTPMAIYLKVSPDKPEKDSVDKMKLWT